MRTRNKRPGRSGRRSCRHWIFSATALALPWLSGCAGFWDEITSRDFDYKSVFITPNPMVVLRDSTDGDKRAKALRSLQEPNASGGSAEEQDAILKILVTASTTERQPLCRLAAMQSLGKFKDPRAVDGLKDAFYAAGTYPPDTATVLRCQALQSLGDTKNPAAVELLAKVAREPPAEGTEQERQQVLDMRIAAARALGNFNQYQGVEALVQVMKSEKDVALKDRAYDSLVLCTGKELPAEAGPWEEYLNQQEKGRDIAPEKKKLFGIVEVDSR